MLRIDINGIQQGLHDAADREQAKQMHAIAEGFESWDDFIDYISDYTEVESVEVYAAYGSLRKDTVIDGYPVWY